MSPDTIKHLTNYLDMEQAFDEGIGYIATHDELEGAAGEGEPKSDERLDFLTPTGSEFLSVTFKFERVTSEVEIISNNPLTDVPIANIQELLIELGVQITDIDMRLTHHRELRFIVTRDTRNIQGRRSSN